MVKCKVCETRWSITKTKVCPKCGATPAGVLPAAPGSAFSTRVQLNEPPPREPAGVIDAAEESK